MKILHVTKKYPNALGGDAIVVQNLENQQTKNNHEVFILTTNCDEIINKPNVIKFGLKDTPANLDNITMKRILSLIDLYKKFPKIIKDIKPDVVHCHSIDMGYVISKACKKYDVPLIETFHTGLISKQKNYSSRSILEHFFIKHSKFKKIISVNNKDKGYLPNLVYIPNGIDTKLFKNDNKKRKGLLFVGRIEKLKGLSNLMQSLNQIKQIEYSHLTIIGEGPEKENLSAYAKKPNLGVRFLGKKSQKELVNFYNQHKILILPSTEIEGFGLVLLEAMACKTPVITTNLVGMAQEIKENNCGLIVPPNNQKTLAEAITKIIKNQKLAKQMGENGRKLVEEKYTWNKVAKQIEKVYFEAIK